MKRECLIGIFCLIVAGFAGADYLATSIQTDGSVILTTSGSDMNGSFTSRAMAIDTSEVALSVGEGEGLDTDLSVKSSGPVLVYDYATGRNSIIPDWLACAFIQQTQKQNDNSELFSTGILNKGSYSVSKSIRPDLSGSLYVNGSGLMSFGLQDSGNNSLRSIGFVSGNMTINDIVQHGGRV
ncbi:hypothetical protein [Methanospirillum lacunae]|uniref:Uncharacterized protein n=1 Tax=Methanospirillum lacunae TaxID=668570 RepID=A0A2V2N7P1_9EURY|nr:hypothetical protein [Methanospirillum lacunae]PWR71293.1 hypothetical protein DK846_10515 [Methanospirillum lacunae]